MKRLVLFSLCVLFATSSVSQASLEASAGWDTFMTSTAYLNLGSGPIAFEGVSLGTYDFGGTIGSQNTGDVDTIVKRIDPASVAGDGLTDTIDIEIVALQLVSVGQLDLGAGLDYHFATLQTGQSSGGTMDITFDDADGGTFDSFFDVYFDLRIGSVTGTILFSGSKTFTSSDIEWERGPVDDLLVPEIDNVNRYLAGPGDRSEDFWVPSAFHDAGDGSTHTVSTPEPATLCLFGLGGLLLRRRKSA